MVARLAAARTIARADYSALGGSITADDTTHTGNGGNPDLKPIRSTNLDATFEWYFAPRSLVSAGLFFLAPTNHAALRPHPTALPGLRPNKLPTLPISGPFHTCACVRRS